MSFEETTMEAGASRPVDPSTFIDHPENLLWLERTASLEMPVEEVNRIQLAAVQKRFADLKEKLPVLKRLADEQGISEIKSFEDAAKLLFKHSVYKSYPISLIEKGRYDRLTQWLSNLTTADLSQVKTDDIETIDDWCDALLRDAGVRITHSTGTSGKLSFLPRGPKDGEKALRGNRLSQTQVGEAEPRDLSTVPMVVVGHRVMFNGYGSGIDMAVRDLYGGDESMLYVMNPGRLSADVLSLGGRLSAASNRGEVGRSQISPTLLARLDKFREEQKNAPARRAEFFDRIFNELLGKRVIMSGNWAMYHEMMDAGRERGMNGIFAPDSIILCAGGTKGKVLPEGFKEEILEFLGIDHITEGYGMSELSGLMGKCSAGHYHAPPWMMVFLLDPETGELFPREGTHTGRFGAIDLTIEERWGGILSGDEVTMTFGKCPCGLETPYINDEIRRYSDKEGGDDKITCAGAPEAHDNALDFLAELD